MENYRIVFLCHFSNPQVRETLRLKTYKLLNLWLRLRGRSTVRYDDFAIWVTDFIQEFEKHPEYEIHIVAPHKGMKNRTQQFVHNGIHYHFFKCDSNYFVDLLNNVFRMEEKNNYSRNRKNMKCIIDSIQPNIVLLCGAENPYYSIGALDVKETPIYVILQTLLNDPKRIEMGVGSAYRRKVESDIFRHARYFSTTNDNAIRKIKEINNDAIILPSGFPTHRSYVSLPKDYKFDFVFFARGVTKNKGIEDLLEALAIVKTSSHKILLNVIGRCDEDYLAKLKNLIVRLGIQGNVVFSGYYESIDNTFANVVKAKIVVVPGITAGLNSTVRESMFLGLPTVCYETNATEIINKEKHCLITAEMSNVDSLAIQMQWAIENPFKLQEIATNGKEYAERVFGNETIVNRLLDNCCQIIKNKI